MTPKPLSLPGINSPAPRSYNLAQGATFRQFDLVSLTAAAAGKTPAPTGDFPGAPPLAAAITITNVASAGAPAATYYLLFSYTATSKESPISAEFIQNCPAGFVPQVNVSATGSPTGSTNYACYASVVEGAETLQQATKTTTALGTNFTIPNPLINPSGISRAASNANSGIAGLVLHDSGALYATGVGGSNTAGGINQLLGTWGNPPPLGGFDAAQALVMTLVNGQPLEMSLKQPWLSSLEGSQAGITLDTSQQAAGVFIADTSATACLTILERLDLGGNPLDTGARVRAIFNASAVI